MLLFLSVFSNLAFYLIILLLFTLLLCHFFLLSLLFCSYFYFILHFSNSLRVKKGHLYVLSCYFCFWQHFFQPSHVVIFCSLLGFLPPFFFYLLFLTLVVLLLPLILSVCYSLNSICCFH